MAVVLTIFALVVAFAVGIAVGARRRRAEALGAAPSSAARLQETVRFEPGVARGTRSVQLTEHTGEWRDAMKDVGRRMRDANVAAVVFASGTFTGDDPLSAIRLVDRSVPAMRGLARGLRGRTRAYVDRVLGDLGHFGARYVRLFEEAVGGDIPCTTFVWSSENHHVGRLEGALDLVRVLARHAELARTDATPTLLVMGHSHAGQVFALVTQLLSGTLASEAILDVARARALDVAGLEADVASLGRVRLDFVTFGAPARYAWAKMPGVRALHVMNHRVDWVQRIGSAATDFPALAAEDRRVNAALDERLGAGFSPVEIARAMRAGLAAPDGDVLLVDYGHEKLTEVLTSGLGHGVYTRLDAMLFHASLVTTRLYAEPPVALPPTLLARVKRVVS